MKHHNSRRLILLLALFMIPVMVLLLLLFSYTINRNDLFNQAAMENVLKISMDRTDRSLKLIESTAMDTLYSYDWLIFSNTSDASSASRRAADIAVTMQTRLQSTEGLIGILLYDAKCDYYYPGFLRTFSLATQQKIRGYLVSSMEHSVPGWSWIDSPEQNDFFLIYICNKDYGKIGIIVQPSVDQDSRHLSGLSEESVIQYMVSDSLSDPEAGWNRLVVKSSAAPVLCLSCLSPVQSLSQRMDTPQKIMLMMMILLLGVMSAVFIHAYRQVLQPISILYRAMKHIQRGELDYRIEMRNGTLELREFARTFNEMLETVYQLNEQKYAQEMETTRARLQYLQIQIRPHFYLNCLKNMYALVDRQDYQSTEELILSLSAYLRYMFKDNSAWISLSEEVAACSNYIRLYQLLGSDISLTMQIGADCAEIQVLPLSLLTFLENSVKHANKVRGITIRLGAVLRENELLMMIADNGGGFSDEQLVKLNEPDMAKFSYREEHIGISNVIYRLKLTFGDCASVQFENQNGGARVTIHQPLQKGKKG